jgi:hypothetical protein
LESIPAVPQEIKKRCGVAVQLPPQRNVRRL